MITAVLDTNVLASGFVSRTGAPGQLLFSWTYGMFELVISEAILTELERTFQNPYFRGRLASTQVVANLTLLRRQATIIPITALVEGVATHPEDDLVLATAESAHADYLVTGDKKLQRLRTYQQITILSPREFLDLLSP